MLFSPARNPPLVWGEPKAADEHDVRTADLQA